MDDNKPDPLSSKQLNGWELEWIEADDIALPKDLSFVPTHCLQGTLLIGGEYLVLSLQMFCVWSPGADPQHGTLYYSCHANARFWSKLELKQKQKLLSKADAKIRSKMVPRLREDAYISKLFGNEPVPLAQAKIRVDTTDLEERVDVSEDICEGCRRAVWSSAESPLEVVEVLLQFPSLPTTIHDGPMDGASTHLANRAKLRLLEDAMLDACEQEGDGDIINDLKISSSVPKSNSDPQSRKKVKKHKSNE